MFPKASGRWALCTSEDFHIMGSNRQMAGFSKFWIRFLFWQLPPWKLPGQNISSLLSTDSGFHFIDPHLELERVQSPPSPAFMQSQHWSRPAPTPCPSGGDGVWCLSIPAPFLIWILGMLFPWGVGNTVWLPGICQQLPSLPCWLSQGSCVLGGGWAHFFWMLMRTLWPS